ncbi:hypothetical protein HY972_02995 [Candidatus Kaiserbacteria bacterium]|nr:hypothetical protein [Candidatus Kaiserbacteria bacterium]
MTDDIRFVLEQALRAPSGDNTQPWRWVVRGESIELWNESSDDPLHTLYSGSRDNSQASYLSFGAAIENASVAATTRGYRAEISYFPDPACPLLIAVLALLKDPSVAPDPLADFLAARVTNRRPYRRVPLADAERAALLSATEDRALGEIKLLDDRQSVAKLATIASLHDELIFSIKRLHAYIFSHINWTRREDDRRRIGFYFPTLAAPPFTWGFMQLMRHWWFMRIGIACGLHRFISLEQRIIYRESGGYGIMLLPGDSPADWVRVGRLTERVWLAATREGLSLHPLNGVILLSLSVETEEGKRMFSRAQRQRLVEGSEGIARIFGVERGRIAFLFRVGRGRAPGGRTSRLPFERLVEVAAPLEHAARSPHER